MKMIDGFSRRNRVDLFSPAEKAIQNAVDVVEHAGAHPHLTDAVVLLAAARAKVADFVDEVPMKARTDFPFFSDGCSMAPDMNFGGCCYDHDVLYHQGGSARERFVADKKLFTCIRGKKGFVIAASYFLAVRLFGGPLLPTFFRWGYGWNYKKSWTYAQQKRLNSK